MINTQNICWIDKCALLDFMERTAAAFVDTVLITRYAIMLLEFVNRDANPDIKGKIAQKVCGTKVFSRWDTWNEKVHWTFHKMSIIKKSDIIIFEIKDFAKIRIVWFIKLI